MKPTRVCTQAVAIVAVIIATFAVPVAAQSSSSVAAPQTAAAASSSGPDQIVLDVVVRDKKGRPITDLKPSDLTILDNGAQQKITGFRLIQGASAVGPDGASTPLDPLHRIELAVLVFEARSSLARSDGGAISLDGGPGALQSNSASNRQGAGGNVRSDAEQRKLARTAALDFVKSGDDANVYYAVMAINNRLLVIQPFTKDKAALEKAIESATAGTAATALAADSDSIVTRLRAAPAGADPVPSALARTMLGMMRRDQAVIGMDARLSITALGSMVAGLQEVPGRKSILYFTTGMVLTPELDVPFNNLISQANRANVTVYGLDTRGVSSVSENEAAAAQLKSAANASATTINNVSGPVSRDEMMAGDNAEVAARANVQIPLRRLADETGGVLIGDTNDMRGPLRKVAEEMGAYYELTYNPGIANYDGAFRKIKVETARKNTVIRGRSGYLALPSELRSSGVMPFEVPLMKAISDGGFSADAFYRAGAVLLRPHAAATDATLMVEVPLSALKPLRDPASSKPGVHFALLAMVKNPAGDVVQKLSHDRAFPVTPEQLTMGNFIDKLPLALAPGNYTLESAVMDRESGKISARRSEFTVGPWTKGVGISSITSVRAYTPNAKNLNPNEPFQFQGGTISPTLNNAVPRKENSALRLFFTVYPDQTIAAKPTVEIEFLLNGKTLTKAPLALPDPDAQGRIPYVMTIPASSIPPGVYEIRATAHQGDSVSATSTTVKIEL
jgi:VWFA-related protein